MAQYMGLRGTSLRTAIAITAGICFIAFGYGQADIAGLLSVETFQQQFPQIGKLNSALTLHVAQMQGITIGVWNLGCFASAMVAVVFGQYFGRRTTIIIGLIIMIIGKAIQASSFSLGQLIAGRFIAGMGNGLNACAVPAWQAECTKAHRRGTMLLISSGAAVSAGLALGYWMTFALAWATPSEASWRFPTAFQGVPALLGLCLLPFLPESPRYLILTGREQAALDVLSALADAEPTDHEVRQDFMQIKDTILMMASGGVSSAFKMGEYRYVHRTILAVLLQFMQQFTGINLFTQFLAPMFENDMNFEPWVARLLASCCATVLTLFSLIAVVGIDRYWGRRWMSMFGATGMCVCLVIITILNYEGTHATHIAQAVFTFLYNGFFAFGWQGMSWLWAVELTPLATRGTSNALSTAANWLANFVVVIITPVAFYNITYKTYIIFAVMNAAIVPTIYFFYPETGSRSLEEVDVLFSNASESKSPWTAIVHIANNEPFWRGKDGETGFDYDQSDWHQHLAGHRGSSEDGTHSTSPTTQSPPSSSGHGEMDEKREAPGI